MGRRPRSWMSLRTRYVCTGEGRGGEGKGGEEVCFSPLFYPPPPRAQVRDGTVVGVGKHVYVLRHGEHESYLVPVGAADDVSNIKLPPCDQGVRPVRGGVVLALADGSGICVVTGAGVKTIPTHLKGVKIITSTPDFVLVYDGDHRAEPKRMKMDGGYLTVVHVPTGAVHRTELMSVKDVRTECNAVVVWEPSGHALVVLNVEDGGTFTTKKVPIGVLPGSAMVVLDERTFVCRTITKKGLFAVAKYTKKDGEGWVDRLYPIPPWNTDVATVVFDVCGGVVVAARTDSKGSTVYVVDELGCVNAELPYDDESLLSVCVGTECGAAVVCVDGTDVHVSRLAFGEVEEEKEEALM